MTVLAKLQEDMKAAMKSGQKERLQVIRMLISDVNVLRISGSSSAAAAIISAQVSRGICRRRVFGDH